MAPTASTGQRMTWRMSMATATWSWLTSLVMRVMSDGVPKRSTSAKEKRLTTAKSSRRMSVPMPWLARDAIFWHTSVKPNPQKAKATRATAPRVTTEASPRRTPESIIQAMTRGVSRSNTTSSVFMSGPSTSQRR